MNRVHQRVHCVGGTQRAQGLDGGRTDRDFPSAAMVVMLIALTVGRARGGNEPRNCGWISQPLQRQDRRRAQVGVPFFNQRLAQGGHRAAIPDLSQSLGRRRLGTGSPASSTLIRTGAALAARSCPSAWQIATCVPSDDPGSACTRPSVASRTLHRPRASAAMSWIPLSGSASACSRSEADARASMATRAPAPLRRVTASGDRRARTR